MDILVNDTNIFIDLHSVGLLGEVCKLPYEIHTLDLILAELTNPAQRMEVEKYIDRGEIRVHSLSASEVMDVAVEHASVRGNLSFEDVAVCRYARMGEFKLLTGDRQLRKYAEKLNVEVHGIIFLIDELVTANFIDPGEGIKKLKELLRVNIRLPKSEIVARIERWESLLQSRNRKKC